MGSIDNPRIQELSQILKALGHPTRLFIIEEIAQEPTCVCVLKERIGADTSTVSKHLSILRNAGLVSMEKKGTMVYYSLSCACVKDCIQALLPLIELKHKRYCEMLQ